MTVVAPSERDAVTVRMTIDRFLRSSRCTNPNTRRAYASVLDRLATQLGPDTPLAGVAADKVTAAVQRLWGTAAPATRAQRCAAVGSWLAWCAGNGHTTPTQPVAERRTRVAVPTRTVTPAEIELLLSRRDVPLRERTLWRMLYETGAPAGEILALNIEDLDLRNRRAAVRSDAASTGWVHWTSVTADLLVRLVSGRTHGPVFLTERRPHPSRRPGPADVCPHTGRARLGYDRARVLLNEHTVRGDGRAGWDFGQLASPCDPRSVETGRSGSEYQLSP